jgi:multiple sugar transport system ATP-binding protein
VLRNGQLQQFASPSDLYDKPANAFVAGFIGSPAMNLLTAPITPEGVRIGENSTLELDRDQLTQLHGAGLEQVTVGIRPEHLILNGTENGILAVVDLVEELGSESYVYTHLGTGNEALNLVARAAGRAPARQADTVGLHLADGPVHLFHPITGLRIT